MDTPALQCEEFELILSEVLDRADLPPAAQLHLTTCSLCAAMVADFDSIALRVRGLANAEVVPDLWPEIRQQLLAEGLIHNGTGDCASPSSSQPKLVRSASTPRRA